MRKRIAAIAAIIGTAAILTATAKIATAERRADFYPATGYVCEVSAGTDLVVVETYTGNLFAFRGAEDWEVGDAASLIMDSRATAEVEDDEVVSAEYAGWNLGR